MPRVTGAGRDRLGFVDTAAELAPGTGPDGVVLREVARPARVSHYAAYGHFDNRAARVGARD